MGLFDLFRPASPETVAQQSTNAARLANIEAGLHNGQVPATIAHRLADARSGRLPWIATLTPAELMITRSHGLKPIASVSATCWMHYGWSWTEGHAQGWQTALRRLRAEARAAGANAVLDVKMRTLPLQVPDSMDFTLVGTAVHVDGLPPSPEPVVATVPSLEFVKLLEADVVPTGIAVGAKYDWLTDYYRSVPTGWMGNSEVTALSQLWEGIRQRAHAELRQNAKGQGNGVLAHVNFSEIFRVERDGQPLQYLARHIVVATTVDTRPGKPFPHDIAMVVDMHAGATPLTGTSRHHQSYASNDQEGAI